MGFSHAIGVAIFLLATSLNITEAYVKVSLGSDNAQWTLTNDKLQIRVENATVPGGVYTDLAGAGVIFPVEELYYRFNDVNTRWVAYENWNYSATFRLNVSHDGTIATPIMLDCEGKSHNLDL